LLFLTGASVSGDKAPFRSASQAGPELTESAKPGWYAGRATYEPISELVAILRRDKFVLARSAPLASFDAAESVACLQWVIPRVRDGVDFSKTKKEHARRARAICMAFVVTMANTAPAVADLIYEHTASGS
jgi:hypothetical protein